MHTFTDADFVMDCILAAVDFICPEQHDVFKAIPLSARTVTQRLEDLASDVQSSMLTKFKNLDIFSIALDESINIKETVQLAIFVHGITQHLEVAAEADYGDLLYHTEVRWLSHGNVLKHVFALRHEIVSTVIDRGLKGFQTFSDEVWLHRVGFHTEIVALTLAVNFLTSRSPSPLKIRV
ncbi:unnamed protein product [Schistocephalus solidus]|uniref:DUF4371 domain-containing protein n=1 Tax=Schistocephalus solidus TaxID=70667 RepID=A0A183TRL9_SCHSO|nr:unnamed protein product [Schistocephalus solidus]